MKYFTPTKLSENIHETPEGYLICYDVPIGRTGSMVYGAGETPLEVGADGKILISRDADELFSPETMASFEGKSFTIQHPEEFVDPSNWKELTKGVLQNVRRAPTPDDNGEEYLLSDILVTDSVAIGLIKSGLREVSCGYEAMYDSTGKGTGKQYQIRGNHLALVDQGRAGSSYAIMDSKYKERSTMQKFADKLKGLVAKALDEAMESEKKKEAKDLDPMAPESQNKPEMTLGELTELVKQLMQKIDSMKPKEQGDEKKDDKDEKKKSEDAKEDSEKKDEDKTKDEGETEAQASTESSMDERLKALEMAVSKLLEHQSEAEKEDTEEDLGDDEDLDQIGDEAPFGKTSDTASRCEILAPGQRFVKNAKALSLKAAYSTRDGKEIIDSLTAGKPNFEDPLLFASASEVLKLKRGTGLGATKNSKAFDSASSFSSGPKTPEELNKMHQEYWAAKKTQY